MTTSVFNVRANCIRTKQSETQKGFTLVELLVTLAIAGILLVVAFPSLNKMTIGQRLKVQTNDTLAAILYAKSEAIQRRSEVSVCAIKTNVHNQCGSSSSEWANGWLVFNDRNGDGIVGTDDEILKSRWDYKKMTSGGVISVFVFDAEGIADNSGDIEFCFSEAEGNKMRRISMTPAGQPAITSHATCG